MQAALFPGQGSQKTGMGKFLYDNFQQAKDTFEEANDTLKQDFKKLCFDGPLDQLSLTQNTQPALLLVSTATHRVINSLMPLPLTAVAGHSIGEYAAVVAAKGLSFSEALVAVRKRGLAMQEAVPVGEGSMLAVLGLGEDQVRQLCQWTMENSGEKPLEPANFNAPGQIVISGSTRAVKWLKENFSPDLFSEKPRQAKLIPLNVSAPFHCSLMKPAQETMDRVLAELNFNDTECPVVQNTDAQPRQSASDIRNHLVSQVSSPVQWIKCIEKMKELGIQRFIEMGTGKVLSGLVKKIDSESFTTFNVNSLEDITELEKTTT